LGIVASFLVSTNHGLSWTSADIQNELGITNGAMGLAWRPEGWRVEDDPYPTVGGWGYARIGGRASLSWWIERYEDPDWQSVSVPLWMPFLVIALPTGILWYRDRRSTADALDRWKVRLCPREPKRWTFKLVLLSGAVHIFIVLPLVIGGTLLVYHLFPANVRMGPFSDRPIGTIDVFHSILDWWGIAMFFGTPLWVFVWAYLYVRFANRLFAKYRPGYCGQCGYDLKGNTSGTCPECGEAVRTAATA
jgi:uncharacterized membrane protein (DUF485 family)